MWQYFRSQLGNIINSRYFMYYVVCMQYVYFIILSNKVNHMIKKGELDPMIMTQENWLLNTVWVRLVVDQSLR